MGVREAWQGLTGANEIRIPVCTLPRPTPIEVVYAYVDGQPRSHQLQFRKGRIPTFEVRLARNSQDLEQLCSALEGAAPAGPGDEEDGLGFWTRLGLRMVGRGTPMWCREAIAPSTVDGEILGLRATYTFRYRVARLRRADQEHLLLLSSVKTESRRSSQRTSLNWFRLLLPEADLLASRIRTFMAASGAFGTPSP